LGAKYTHSYRIDIQIPNWPARYPASLTGSLSRESGALTFSGVVKNNTATRCRLSSPIREFDSRLLVVTFCPLPAFYTDFTHNSTNLRYAPDSAHTPKNRTGPYSLTHTLL